VRHIIIITADRVPRRLRRIADLCLRRLRANLHPGSPPRENPLRENPLRTNLPPANLPPANLHLANLPLARRDNFKIYLTKKDLKKVFFCFKGVQNGIKVKNYLK
jgi:hypothetical protein